MLLEGGVVDQNVEAPVMPRGLVDGGLAEGGIGDVARKEQAPPARAFDRALRFLGVFLLLGEVDDRDVGAFARVEVRDGRPIPESPPVTRAIFPVSFPAALYARPS